MTHLMTLDDWDSGGFKYAEPCDCPIGEDHGQSRDCECGAELDEFGLCWFCDRNWIWSGP